MKLSLRCANLDVIVGIPVRVVDDDGVSRSKINAQTTSSGREKESKLRSPRSCQEEKQKENEERKKVIALIAYQAAFICNTTVYVYCIWLTIKAIDSLLSQVASDSSINSLIFVSLVLQEVLQQVQHFGHLGEDQNPVASILQLPHHLLQQHQFS